MTVHTNQLSTRDIVKPSGRDNSYHQLASGDRRNQALALFLAHSAAFLMNLIDTDGVAGFEYLQNPSQFTQNLSMIPFISNKLHSSKTLLLQGDQLLEASSTYLHVTILLWQRCPEMKTPLICACSLYFTLIIYAIPPGHTMNIPMQNETFHISMCSLAEQKPRIEHFLCLSQKQSFPIAPGGCHLRVVQSSYGKEAILNIDIQQKR